MNNDRPVRIAFRTTGCKVNQFDTTAVIDALAGRHVVFCDPEDNPDIVVVNACTVTMNADRDGRAAAYKAARTGARVIVAGCLATRLEERPEGPALPAEITVVGGTADRSRLVAAIDSMITDAITDVITDVTADMKNGSGAPDCVKICDETSDAGAAGGQNGAARTTVRAEPLSAIDGRNDEMPDRTDGIDDQSGGNVRSRPLIKIQDGCDCRCTYCIVPHVRGRSVSEQYDRIEKAVLSAAASGASEVVLTGVDLAAWGKNGDGRYGRLSELLVRLSGLGTGMRFRLSSLEPHGLDRELVETIVRCSDICRHLHIPMQSGSDSVLARMNRPYGAAQFEDLVSRAASAIPGLTLGMDVIVGFPGETDAEFHETLSMINRLPTTYLHVFPYSPRPGTPAATMPGQVPDPIKKERGRLLRETASSRRAARAASFVGKTVETVDIRPVESGVESLSSEYFKVFVTNRIDMAPGRRMIRIAGFEGTALFGEDMTSLGGTPVGRTVPGCPGL